MGMTNLRTLLFGCVLCGLLAACENSNYASERQEETSMFSLFKKKYPTTVNPLLQAELKQIDSFPAAPAGAAPISGSTCTKYAVKGKPPEVVLSAVEKDIIAAGSSIGFVISDRPDNAVLLMNLSDELPHGLIELWQLKSREDLQLVSKIPAQISPKESSWGSRFAQQAVCLPNGRVLVGINYSRPEVHTDFFLYNIEQRRFSTFFNDYDLRFSEAFETQPLSEYAALLLHFSQRTTVGFELSYNYYNHLQLFTRAHPDGLEVVKLGIDIGNVKQWRVIDKTLYLHTHDPRTPDKPRETYFSLDLSKLLTN
jgi:hypothetical protein